MSVQSTDNKLPEISNSRANNPIYPSEAPFGPFLIRDSPIVSFEIWSSPHRAQFLVTLLFTITNWKQLGRRDHNLISLTKINARKPNTRKREIEREIGKEGRKYSRREDWRGSASSAWWTWR
jgi:hypothetical protein